MLAAASQAVEREVAGQPGEGHLRQLVPDAGPVQPGPLNGGDYQPGGVVREDPDVGWFHPGLGPEALAEMLEGWGRDGEIDRSRHQQLSQLVAVCRHLGQGQQGRPEDRRAQTFPAQPGDQGEGPGRPAPDHQSVSRGPGDFRDCGGGVVRRVLHVQGHGVTAPAGGFAQTVHGDPRVPRALRGDDQTFPAAFAGSLQQDIGLRAIVRQAAKHPGHIGVINGPIASARGDHGNPQFGRHQFGRVRPLPVQRADDCPHLVFLGESHHLSGDYPPRSIVRPEHDPVG